MSAHFKSPVEAALLKQYAESIGMSRVIENFRALEEQARCQRQMAEIFDQQRHMQRLVDEYSAQSVIRRLSEPVLQYGWSAESIRRVLAERDVTFPNSIQGLIGYDSSAPK